MGAVALVIAAKAETLRGMALYWGYLSVVGRIEGHADPLPAAALRCANCHERALAPEGGAAPPRTIVPLDRGTLTVERQHRTGPAFAYDEATFCDTLRSGIDPAMVVLPRPMPRFDLPPSDCAALWAYLSRRRP